MIRKTYLAFCHFLGTLFFSIVVGFVLAWSAFVIVVSYGYVRNLK